MKLRSIALILALLPAALFAAGGNSGGTTTSTPSGPTVIPGGAFTTAYVISAPGSYVLGGNRSTNGAANGIEITAPDVTLDLNGFTLSQTGAGAVSGIYVASADNLEIRNGSIQNWGKNGIWLKAGADVRILNIRASGSVDSGIMLESTKGAQVEHCMASACGGCGIFVYTVTQWVLSQGALVSDCVVKGCPWGVSVQNGGRIVRAIVSDAQVNGLGLGYYSTATDCTVTGCGGGVAMEYGSTLRNSDVVNNTTGVNAYDVSGVIMGSRISLNSQTNIQGTFTNGGGNVIQ